MKTILFSKYSIFVTTILFFLVSACATTHDFLSENFNKAKNSHQKIAILPFKVRFSYFDSNNREVRNIPDRQKKFMSDQEFLASKDAQQDLFMGLAKQIRKGRFELVLQDFNTTNKILDENRIRLQRVSDGMMGLVANTLGVDAVFSGELQIRVTSDNQFQMMPPNYNDGVEAFLKLFDTKSGEMLWSNSFSQRPSSPRDTPHRITTNLIDSFAKSVPYRQKK